MKFPMTFKHLRNSFLQRSHTVSTDGSGEAAQARSVPRRTIVHDSKTMDIYWDRDEDYTSGTVEGIHTGGTEGSLGNVRGKRMTSGFHHIALVVRDLAKTIKFYESALGMKCRAVYPMHGVPGLVFLFSCVHGWRANTSFHRCIHSFL